MSMSAGNCAGAWTITVTGWAPGATAGSGVSRPPGCAACARPRPSSAISNGSRPGSGLADKLDFIRAKEVYCQDGNKYCLPKSPDKNMGF